MEFINCYRIWLKLREWMNDLFERDNVDRRVVKKEVFYF